MKDSAIDPALSVEELLAHRGFLERVAREYSTSTVAAEDLVQDMWLTLLHRPVRREGSLRGWFRTAVRNALRNQLRAERRRSHHHREAPAKPDASGTDVEYEQRLATDRLRAALDSLEARQLAVLELRYFEGLPPREIAARLGAPVETVRTWHRRAMERIRRDMERKVPWWAATWPALLLWRRRRAAVASLGAAGLALVAVGAALLTGDGDRSAADLRPDLASFVEASTTAGVGASTSTSRTASEPGPVDERRAVVSALAIEVRRADGDPAPDLPLLIEGWTETGRRVEHRARTGEDGRAVVELESGSWKVSPIVGAPVWGEVARSDAPTPLRLDLPESPRIEGIVLGPGGLPAVGAAVLVSWPDRESRWAEVARTDARGAFELPAVDRGSWVTARHGELDSEVAYRSAAPSSAEAPGELEIALAAPSAAFRARIADANGQPVRNARLQMAMRGAVDTVAGGYVAAEMCARTVWTDERGDFVLTCHARHSATWIAEAPGLAARTFHPAPRRLDVLRMDPPSTLVGRVLLPNGEPVAGATVELVDRHGEILSRVRSGSNGAYELASGTGPAYSVVVPSGGEGAWPSGCRPLRTVEDPSKVDVVLRGQGSIRGVARTEAGAPLSGWKVLLRPAASAPSNTNLASLHPTRVRTTDGRGRFRFEGCSDLPFDLWLYPPDGSPATDPPSAFAVDVTSRRGRTALRVPTAEPLRAAIEGSIPRASAGSFLTAMSRESKWVRRVGPDPRTGTFRIGGLPPGPFSLGLTSSEGYYELARGRLAPGQEYAMGEIALGAGGEVRVQLPRGFAFTCVRLSGTLRKLEWCPAAARADFELDEASFRVADLPPGRYTLEVEVGARPVHSSEIVVSAGECTEVEVDLVAPRPGPDGRRRTPRGAGK